MALMTFSRFEKKYLLTEEKKNILCSFLLDYLELDQYNKNNSFYSIYNIYYDTTNNELIRNSIEKPIYKEKLRLRSYKVPLCDDDIVYLEIKRKALKKVNKRRVSLTYKEANDYIVNNIRPKRDDYISNQVLNELDYLLSRYKFIPNYFISYDRVAFFAKDDSSIRITFDKNIKERKENVNFDSIAGSNILPNSTWLMEIKVGNSFPIWLANKLSELEIYPVSFSKYGMAYKINREKEVLNYVDN